MSLGIAELVLSLKGGRSYDQLSADCGGVPTPSRLNGFVTAQIKSFPNLETITGLSKGLGVAPEQIVAAIGVTLGLWEDSEFTPALMLPRGTESLTDGQRSAVVAVVREFVRANKTA
ncbi:hypothetical protein [Zhihengliuella halotolerans]|uniref:hypothetical protein n=1 Tax=Zhihengliuella halotolerans TaxID=370736 RepID=UPI000C80F20D|nr:hypothetical protein [Zhihengliuella halotolerans]